MSLCARVRKRAGCRPGVETAVACEKISIVAEADAITAAALPFEAHLLLFDITVSSGAAHCRHSATRVPVIRRGDRPAAHAALHAARAPITSPHAQTRLHSDTVRLAGKGGREQRGGGQRALPAIHRVARSLADPTQHLPCRASAGAQKRTTSCSPTVCALPHQLAKEQCLFVSSFFL